MYTVGYLEWGSLMMHRRYRTGRRRKSNSALKNIFSLFVFGTLGAGMMYGGVTWFRSHSKVADVGDQVAVASKSISDAIAPASVSAAALPDRANLVSAFDGQVTGVINRVKAEKTANYHVLAYLPGVNDGLEEYTAWLLKDGLADVKEMGQLSPRADGSWMLDFTADPISGISDAALYKTVVIMKELKTGGSAPSGVKMAEATF